MNIYDVRSLLAFDCEAAGNFLKKLSIPHKHAGQKVFVGPLIGAGEVVGYYYWSPVYYDLDGQKQMKRKYGEAVIAVIVEEVPK